MAFSMALGVTPELLRSKAAEVSKDIGEMEKGLQTLETEINGTAAYWLGEAGDLHRKKYLDRSEEMRNLIKRLYTYPERILKMAGIYDQAEDHSIAVSETMKTDIEMR